MLGTGKENLDTKEKKQQYCTSFQGMRSSTIDHINTDINTCTNGIHTKNRQTNEYVINSLCWKKAGVGRMEGEIKL